MKLIRLSIVLVLVGSGIQLSHAQPAAVQQLQNNQLSQQLPAPATGLAASTNAPDLYTGENEDVGPQRILRLKPRSNYFNVVLDSQIFYSDNANFEASARAIGSAVFVNTVQAALTPPARKIGNGDFAAAIGFVSQWYNYDNSRLESLDFNAETAFVSGKYNLGKWQLGVGINLTRLVDQGDYAETYREFMPSLGIQRLIPINDRMFFALGDLVDYHLTEVPSVLGSRTDINDRLDNIASLTFTWMATSHLVIQPFYRFQYSYYQHDSLTISDRNDYMHSFGLAAAYYFNQSLSLRAYYNYNRRQSDDKFTPAYHEMNGGLGLAFDWKF